MKRKLTLIKVCDRNYKISQSDIERWAEVFKNTKINNPDKYNIISDGDVKVEQIEIDDEENTILFVKVGSDSYAPTPADLEAWRDVFEEAKDDPEFNIFTHEHVEVQQVKIGDLVAVE